jgi:hypothetical protein
MSGSANQSATVLSPLDELPQQSQDDQLHDNLRQQIHSSLQKASGQKQQLKKLDRRYSLLNICLGALATFVTGQSAVANQPVIGNWQMTTTLASVLTLGATVVSGFHKQLAAPDLLAETSACVAKLKALKVETVDADYDVEQISDAYQQILADFSKVDC